MPCCALCKRAVSCDSALAGSTSSTSPHFCSGLSLSAMHVSCYKLHLCTATCPLMSQQSRSVANEPVLHLALLCTLGALPSWHALLPGGSLTASAASCAGSHKGGRRHGLGPGCTVEPDGGREQGCDASNCHRPAQYHMPWPSAGLVVSYDVPLRRCGQQPRQRLGGVFNVHCGGSGDSLESVRPPDVPEPSLTACLQLCN